VEPYRVADLPDPLARNITIDPETGEWIWTGLLDRDGYGRYRGEAVHRVVYKLLIGAIPGGRVASFPSSPMGSA
jgi:hypothetical protein